MTTDTLDISKYIRQTPFGPTPNVLADIYHQDVNMATWQRSITSTLTKECETLLEETNFTTNRLTLSISKLDRLGEALTELSDFPNLLEDLQLLIDMFSCLLDLESVGLRLTSMKDAMCPKFHVDRVPCRLITTYSGKGTEWLPHHKIDRRKLGPGSAGLSDIESGLYSSPNDIQTLESGDVAILKGELWEGNEGAGLVHRSPSSNSGTKRLLLTLDSL